MTDRLLLAATAYEAYARAKETAEEAPAGHHLQVKVLPRWCDLSPHEMNAWCAVADAVMEALGG